MARVLNRAVDEIEIPELPWRVILSRLSRLWVVRQAPHHSIIAQTRAGKSFLTRFGILETCKYDRVLIIDCKGDDETLVGLGHVVTRFPRRVKRIRKEFFSDETKARQNWFRLVTHEDTDRAREQVREALDLAYREGNWIIVIDELRYITDKHDPYLGLESYWNRLIFRGGSRGVGVISLTQEPRWVPGAFYTQSSFYWFSRIEDKVAQQRISEIGSSRDLLSYLSAIPRHEWIYTDNLDPERFWAYTKVVK